MRLTRIMWGSAVYTRIQVLMGNGFRICEKLLPFAIFF